MAYQVLLYMRERELKFTQLQSCKKKFTEISLVKQQGSTKSANSKFKILKILVITTKTVMYRQTYELKKQA